MVMIIDVIYIPSRRSKDLLILETFWSIMSSKHAVTDDQIYAIDYIEPFQIILASVSMLFSGSIIYILIQYYNDLVRGKPFIHLLLMMAICDTMSSLALSFGFPRDNALCSIQGFLYIFFERVTWFWLDLLVVQLYHFTRYHKVLLSLNQIHCVITLVSSLPSRCSHTEPMFFICDSDFLHNFFKDKGG